MEYRDWTPPWDEIKRMVKDAGFADDGYGDVAASDWDCFARLVFAVQTAERERFEKGV